MKQSLHNETIEIMLKSLSTSTLQQYSTVYKKWIPFCNDSKYDCFNVSVPVVLKFLTEQFNKGASYSTLNTFRSALSLILGKQLCNNDSVSRFFKGIFKIKPNFPKYHSSWDPNLVLSYLSGLYPNESLSLEILTKKLVTLLALSTGQRVQTLSLIEINNISNNESYISISITDIIKTSTPSRANPRLIIPFFRENESICPAKALSSYIDMTSEYRSLPNTNKLILTTKKPLHSASSQSISRWIKTILKDSGIDVNKFSSHSTRHASTSAASRAGVSVDLIKKTAGWSGNSLCFAKFYNLPLEDSVQDRTFAEAVFNI